MIDRHGSIGRAMSLRQLMDRMLEDAYVMPREGGGEGGGSMSMDVYEDADDLVVEAHLPGLKPDDVDVNVERGVLRICQEISVPMSGTMDWVGCDAFEPGNAAAAG